MLVKMIVIMFVIVLSVIAVLINKYGNKKSVTNKIVVDSAEYYIRYFDSFTKLDYRIATTENVWLRNLCKQKRQELLAEIRIV
jgi:hypothetical protein